MSDKTEADIRRRLCDPLAPDPVTWGRDRDLQRIAELEAQVARLTAPVTEEEAIAADFGQTQLVGRHKRVQAALTAFLERRIKGC
jgi:hypothetical protein